MADKVNVEITRREAIKPCSPTPQHLRIVKLSFLDQINPDMYVPLILFYPFITSNSSQMQQNPIETASERSQCLRETLSKALALYYPFAGRLRNNLFIECNDEGAEFVEAKVAFPMSRVLKNPDSVMLRKFLLAQPESGQDSLGGCLLLVQATIFDCGGIALGLSFSHKISDACTIGGFLRTWAKTANENPDQLLTKPEFGQACDLFPPISDSLSSEKSSMELVQQNCVTRRYVFTAEKIAALKNITASDDHVRNPTRIEAVSGLLWKCVKKAGSSRPSLWSVAMNIRKRIEPSFGDNVAGNLVCGFAGKTDKSEAVDLHELVDKLRKGIEEAVENFAKKGHILRSVQGQLGEFAKLMKSDESDFYTCTSWCRFGLYDADFGWEKPIWMSIVSCDFKNAVALMDTRDGDGIEAWLTFSEEDMASIESNQELLAFASLNPSVI